MVRQEGLDLCFEKLTFLGGKTKLYGGLAITEWKNIPMELLLRIVSLGDDRTVIVASGVCTGWRDAMSWGITQLSLSWCKNNMNNLVLSLAPKFTKLQTLVLRHDKPHLKDNAVEAIAKYCPDLQDLDLSKSFKLSDSALYALGRGCPNLTRLNISGCSAFSDTALAKLAASCRKLKYLNLCGCGRAASDKALKAIGNNCNQLQFLILGWCENVGDAGVMSLAYGCPDLRALDLCGCVLITDESIIALANNCRHLRSLGLYFCQNITDKAMYSLAQSGVKNKKHRGGGGGGGWGVPSKSRIYGSDQAGLMNLNISQCTALTPPAVQAVCDSFPLLHTCPGRHSLIISGCLNLTSVHCACAVQAHRVVNSFLYPAH